MIQPPAAWSEPHALVKDAEQVATDASTRAAELEAISATAAADAARERDAMSAAFSRLETAIESGEDGGDGARPAKDDVTAVGVDAAEVERVAASILADAGDDTLARAKGTADADAAAADADASEADAAAAALSAAFAMPASKKKTRADIFQEVIAKRAEVPLLSEPRRRCTLASVVRTSCVVRGSRGCRRRRVVCHCFSASLRVCAFRLSTARSTSPPPPPSKRSTRSRSRWATCAATFARCSKSRRSMSRRRLSNLGGPLL